MIRKGFFTKIILLGIFLTAVVVLDAQLHGAGILITLVNS